jgi:putative FmdB family regulatory protein
MRQFAGRYEMRCDIPSFNLQISQALGKRSVARQKPARACPLLKITAQAFRHREGLPMPMYDYQCQDCGKESLIVLTISQHDQGDIACPACGSKKVQQVYSPFIAHTTKKS